MPSTLFPRLLGLATLLLAASLAGCAAGGSSGHNMGPAHNVVGATGNQLIASGVPVGSWYCVHINDNFNNRVTINSNLAITPDGVAHFNTGYDCAYKGAYSFGTGKFTGRKRISWTTSSTFRKVQRVGQELYCYPDASSRARLVAGNPPGYSLHDYRTFGQAMPASVAKSLLGDEDGIDIYRIQGKDLVLVNSTDANRWLYKHVR